MPGVIACCAARVLASDANDTLGLPPAPVERPALIDLGRTLFADTKLSRDGRVSCATCHEPRHAFTDARPISIGVDGAHGTRNAPSLVNVAYATSLFWDGRRANLEEQAADPFVNRSEHALASHAELVDRVEAEPAYRPLLDRAFERDRKLAPTDIFRALAAYLQTVRAGGSPVDRYLYAGDRSALGTDARRGLELFRGRAGCAGCHRIEEQSALLTDNAFHGVVAASTLTGARFAELVGRVNDADADWLSSAVASDPAVAALGRFIVTKRPVDIGRYRTPSLRNVALTAPYMHDGSVATLHEAIDHELYYRSLEVGRPLILTPAERDDILAFLVALTSPCLASMTCPGMEDFARERRRVGEVR